MAYLKLDGDELQVGEDYAGNAVPEQQIKVTLRTTDDGAPVKCRTESFTLEVQE